MPCCDQCQGLETMFSRNVADRDLRDYLRNGPAKQTRIMLDTLRQAGVDGLTLLDIGGGIGAIQHELFKSGLRSATDVDASRAYLTVSAEEAARRGYADRIHYVHGDFVELAAGLESADIVTLDRVICCYPDMPAMVRLSSVRAAKFYGLIFPQDRWWMRFGGRVGNMFLALVRNKYRFFIHPAKEVDALIRQNGLQPRFHRNVGLFWQVAVYARG